MHVVITFYFCLNLRIVCPNILRGGNILIVSTLKQLVIVGVSVVVLAGCASSGDKERAEAAARAAAEQAERDAAAKAAAIEAAKIAEAARLAEEARAAEERRKAEAAAAAAAARRVTTLKATGHFDFNKAVLRSDARAALDSGVVSRKGEVKEVNSVAINGHADRIGSVEYNQRLSEKRAEAVKAYLVGQGVPANNIDARGFGKMQPAAGAPQCSDSMSRNKLIKCLQPHRRVEVELNGIAAN